ncbi:MAG: recombinase family protein [Chloroflexi bacterium]|nr:MAG: recombinase family protein [Chloroflexota bacterium]
MSESRRGAEPATNTTRAVIYLRVSDKQQVERDDTEEGYSLPAQREASVQLIREQGWSLVDEYCDRGESASKDDDARPQFNAMLQRIFEQGDVDVVVVHKRDRFARNAARHLALRAALRKRGVRLESVVNKLEETAAGWLAEGIEALVNEYHSANLSAEVKKGMRQKAQMGGWIHRAPLGYLNRKEWEGGRRMAYVIPDPERAPLVVEAFQLYASGDYTVEQLATEMEARGLRMRAWRDRPERPLSINGLRWVLGNKFYVGVVEHNGVEYHGRHEPLVDAQTFEKAQSILASRGGDGTRELCHSHYLKGLLVCGVCGRRLSIQFSKGKYVYFYCLGQKDRRRPTGCREAYVPVTNLEQQVEALYARIQLRPEMAERLRGWLEVELISREERNVAEREFQAKRLEKLNAQRRKLLDAYYAAAIDVAMLREEQDRLRRETADVEERLREVDATLAQWQEILGIALRFAESCGAAYRVAKERTRALYNRAVFERLIVRNGRVAEPHYAAPFDLVFGVGEFEQGSLERETGLEPATSSLEGTRCYLNSPFHQRLPGAPYSLFCRRTATPLQPRWRPQRRACAGQHFGCDSLRLGVR